MSIQITRITTQKKHKDRYALFQGDSFLTGVSQEILLKYSLHTGSILSEKEFNRLKKEERLIAIREQALRYLSRRAHSTKELTLKLQQKGYALKSIETVTADLQKKGYLNDVEFARMFLREELRLKRTGPLLIKNKLMIKGISLETIEKILVEMYDTRLQYENCRTLAAKKLNTLQALPIEKQKQRVTGFLRQKGFGWEICRQVYEVLFQEAS